MERYLLIRALLKIHYFKKDIIVQSCEILLNIMNRLNKALGKSKWVFKQNFTLLLCLYLKKFHPFYYAYIV